MALPKEHVSLQDNTRLRRPHIRSGCLTVIAICVMLAATSIEAGRRSSCWKKAKALYDSTHPVCEACGRATDDLQTHHVIPFHTDPALECDQENLIRLCWQHHFDLGHAQSFHAYNPNVREDAAEYQRMIRKIVTNRLPNKPERGQ